MGNEPTPEGSGGSDANGPSSHSAGETLPLSETRGVAAIQTAEGRCRSIAPAKKQNTHHADILGEETQYHICAEQVPDDSIIARHLSLAHKRTQTTGVELIDFLGAMPHDIGYCNGNQRGEEDGCDLESLDASAVEVKSQEPN